jgi:hypothetical protein
LFTEEKYYGKSIANPGGCNATKNINYNAETLNQKTGDTLSSNRAQIFFHRSRHQRIPFENRAPDHRGGKVTLPKTIIEIFEKEPKGLQFGKVSVSLVLRWGHCHFEVEKLYTVFVDGGQGNNGPNGGGKGDR